MCGALLSLRKAAQVLPCGAGHKEQQGGVMPNFAARLKRARKAKQLTQLELAEQIQAHRASVQRWERGGDLPTALTILRIADALDTSIRYLLCRVDTPEKWPYLAQDERKLIELYRALPAHGKTALIESAGDLVDAQPKRQKA